MNDRLEKIIGAGAGCLLALFAAAAEANTIGQWSSSGRSWNGGDFTTIKGAMTGAGHVVEADGAISAAGLLNDDVFLIGEATAAPTLAEQALLTGFVNTGGILLVLVDSGGTGVAEGNAALAGIGSTMTFSGSPVNAPLKPGIFATEGPPFNIVGNTLTTSTGEAVNGGIEVAGSYVRYQQLGAGFVFAFADRVDHNFFVPTAANINGQLFLNIAFGQTAAIPEPSTYALMLAGLGLVGFVAVRRKKNYVAA